jgi:hypothetical protein
MSRLAEQQRALLALIKNKPVEGCDDEWVTRIKHSRELVMMREIARWWRQYQVSAQCRFTARLLKRKGMFEEAVNRYFEEGGSSAFIEETARGFLRSLVGGRDGMLRSVAMTELGMLGAKEGLRTVVSWDENPDLVFAALQHGTELPEMDQEFEYRLTIGPRLDCDRASRAHPRTGAALAPPRADHGSQDLT